MGLDNADGEYRDRAAGRRMKFAACRADGARGRGRRPCLPKAAIRLAPFLKISKAYYGEET